VASGADDLHPNGTDTIVLIHGLWVTALIWEQWIARYRARGYRVLAPAWPGLDRGIAELRRDPSGIARLRVTDITAHYRHLIGGLSSPPALIGHCLGGLVVQTLLDGGVGAAGVAINPAPPAARMFPPPMTSVGFPVLRSSACRRSAVTLTERQFRRALAGALDDQQAETAYARYTIPAPGFLIRQAAFPGRTRVRFGNQARAPLLLIGGGKDRIFPASQTRASYRRYAQSAAITCYREYPGRSHYTIGEPGWEHVADYALRWAMDNARQDL
jgi:alpha-beta hydrolase superfamily lysophospholipase